MNVHSVKRTSCAIAGSVAVAFAGAQPATTGLIATDAGHNRIIEFTLPPSELAVLWEGAPLNEPTGMIVRHSPIPEPEYFVSNAGDGSIVAFDWTFTSHRTVVKAGQSTMVSPSDMGLHYKLSGMIYVLDAHDGSVHRFDEFAGTFVDIIIPPLGPASSMTVTSTPSPEFKPVVIIAYPTLGKVLRYDAASGALMNTVAEVQRPAWVSPVYGDQVFVFEDFADPQRPNVVHRVKQIGQSYGIVLTAPPGGAPNDLFNHTNGQPSQLLFDDRLTNAWSGTSIFAEPGSKLDNLISFAPCYADCDPGISPGVMDIFDFLCFQDSFVKGEAYACDCDTSTGNGACDIFDFLCYQNAFIMGCP